MTMSITDRVFVTCAHTRLLKPAPFTPATPMLHADDGTECDATRFTVTREFTAHRGVAMAWLADTHAVAPDGG